MAVKRLILDYPPDVVEEPIVYLLIREYDLKVNILKARIRPRQGGRMIIELAGAKAALEAGMNYLTGLGVRTQSLVRQIQLDKDKCVDCTALPAPLPDPGPPPGRGQIRSPERGPLRRLRILRDHLPLPGH